MVAVVGLAVVLIGSIVGNLLLLRKVSTVSKQLLPPRAAEETAQMSAHLTADSRDAFFSADMMAQNLTMVHLVFHGLFINAIAQLLAGDDIPPSKVVLIIILSVVGAMMSVLAVLREKRQDQVRDWWENHYGQGAVFGEMRKDLPRRWVRHTRRIITGTLAAVYFVIILYVLLMR